MAKVVGFFKTLRNHWKKTTFGILLVSYGINYGREKYVTHQLIKSYCLESKEYGEVPLPIGTPARRITVILNPAANGGKAKDDFEKYCAPLLYLSGMKVSVVKTESIGEARGLMEVLDGTDAVAVAGGDGAVSEVLTGLLRRPDGTSTVQNWPIGIIPVGKINSVACSLFEDFKDDRIKLMAEATMAIVRDVQRPVDIMKVQIVEDEQTAKKPIYAAGQFKWGAFRDAEDRVKKYWFWGSLKQYAAYFFGAFHDLTWNCSCQFRYTLPCDGCQRCKSQTIGTQTVKSKQPSRWWHAFVPRNPSPISESKTAKDYSNVVNPECGVWHERNISTVELECITENNLGFNGPNHPKHLEISIGPEQVTTMQFISEGWRRARENTRGLPYERLAVQQMVIIPSKDASEDEQPSTEKKDVPEKWYSIDNDSYEVKPIQVTLLPDTVRVFAPRKNATT